MRKKLLKRIVCCLCAAMMALGGVPIGWQAGSLHKVRAAEKIETEEKAETPAVPQNLREENGFIVWDEVTDAYGYTLRVFIDGYEREFTYYVNSVELDRFCYENKMDFGEYKFDVCAFDESRNSSAWSNQVTAAYAPALDAPNVRVSEYNSEYVEWHADGAIRYNIRIFRDDEERSLYDTYTTSDTITYLLGDPSGNYWISVQAFDRDYNASEWTEPIMFTHTITIEEEKERLEAPQNVRLDESGENIVWDEVEGAEFYYLYIYYDLENKGRRECKGVYCSQTQFVNWKSYIYALGDVDISIEVSACSSELGWSDYERLSISYESVQDDSIELPKDLLVINDDNGEILQWNVADNVKAYRIFFWSSGYSENGEWFYTSNMLQMCYEFNDFAESLQYIIRNNELEGTYDVELYAFDENGNYNNKVYSVILNTPHDETVWVPEVFYKFDTLLWDYDEFRHEDTDTFWVRAINAKDGTVYECWKSGAAAYYMGNLPNGRYIIEVCAREKAGYGTIGPHTSGWLYKLGPWSEPLTILKHDGGLFDEENKSTEEITAPPEAADIPDDDRITSITINPAFNMKHKDGNDVELDLTKIKIKANEIYDKEGLKRVEEALGEEIKGNKHYNLLDLTLLYDGKDFSNSYEGLVQVIIPLPAGHRDKNFSCYRLTKVDGKTVKEKINGEQTEDSYIIYLEHFSEYVLLGAGEEEAHSHVYSAAWKNNENAHWKECDCGEKSENAKHTYGEWLVTKESTKTETGLKERSCEICGYKQTEDIPKITENKENSSSEAASADEPDDEDKTDTTDTSDNANVIANNTDNNAGNNNTNSNTNFTDGQNNISNPVGTAAENISPATGDTAAGRIVLLYMMSIISIGILLIIFKKEKI